MNQLAPPPDRPADAAWLALRVPADEAARSASVKPLLEPLIRFLQADGGRANIVDLGAGTGANVRWLAPRLPVPQHWTLVDHDASLLAKATAPVPFDTAIARMDQLADLLDATERSDSASLLTCSALLDVLTADDIDVISATAASHGAAAFFSLSVTGAVDLTPGDDVDALISAAFNDHQSQGGRLGPEAPDVARAAFADRGFSVLCTRTDWNLGSDQPHLLDTWLRERVEAAVEQSPDLGAEAQAWLERRLAQGRSSALSAIVEHVDLLALPPAVRAEAYGAGD